MNSGKPTTPRAIRQELGARDRRILDDLMRFRLLTNEAIQRLHLPEAKLNAASKVTARLVKTQWLKSHEYAGNRQYFVAGVKAVRCFGLPTSRSRTLGPQSLAMHLATLEFVATTVPRLRVLTDQELGSWLPTATKAHHAMTHALETISTKTIAARTGVELPLRIFTIEPGLASHVFNPFNTSGWKKFTDDLPLVSKVTELAHDWIFFQSKEDEGHETR